MRKYTGSSRKRKEKTVELAKKWLPKDCQLYFFANNNLSSAATGSTRRIVNELKTSRITKDDKYFSFFKDLIKNHPECD